MKKVLKISGVLILLLILCAVGFLTWARSAADARLSVPHETHADAVPFPFPLSDEEVSQLRSQKLAALSTREKDSQEEQKEGDDVDESDSPDPLQDINLDDVALERSIARGKHLVEARYLCAECHGKDFGGGVLIDDPALGAFLGPNLTPGKGGVTTNYAMTDWDRIVRHGVKPDGSAALMPSADFVSMSDQELADIIAYVGTFPPIDKKVPASSLGPMGAVLIALEQLPLSAYEHPDHKAPHSRTPPATAVSTEFGGHLIKICTGCHRNNLEGGPIASGDPSWPPAANLSPGPDGLGAWSYKQFVVAMREGQRPDGSAIIPPMNLIIPLAQKMSDTELQAMWMFLKAQPALPDGT